MRISDWSSDVCSSDLTRRLPAGDRRATFPAHAEIQILRAELLRGRSARPRRPPARRRRASRRLPERPGEPRGAAVAQPAPDRRRIRGGCLTSGRDRQDRKSVVSGKRVSVRVGLGGRLIINNKKKQKKLRKM